MQMRTIFMVVVLFGLQPHSIVATDSAWQHLAPGMDLKVLAATTPSSVGDSKITVLRIDPKLWELEFFGISQTGESQGTPLVPGARSTSWQPPSMRECLPRTAKPTPGISPRAST